MRRLFSGYALALSVLFGIIGLPCFIFAGFLAKESIDLIQHGVRSQGTVVEMLRVSGRKGSTYKPVVRFTTPEGQTITMESFSSSNPPRYETGDGVVVLYPPGNPNKATIDSFLDLWMPTLLVGLIGVAFVIMAVVAVVRYTKKRQLQSWLQQHGRRIPTQYTNVEENPHLRVNGRRPLRIVTTWKDPATGMDHVFKSEDFWDNPATSLQGRTTIDVLIDPVDPQRYVMDTSFLS